MRRLHKCPLRLFIAGLLTVTFSTGCEQGPPPFPGETRAECIQGAEWFYDENISKMGMSPEEAAAERDALIDSVCAALP
jgi:hypothetical protein